MAKAEPETEEEASGANPTPASAAAPAAPRLGGVSPEEQRKIDNAIADGVWYLKDHMLPEGTWASDLPGLAVGMASLSGLTLARVWRPRQRSGRD